MSPVLFIFYANYCFVWNHFYAHAPYLHDSGWFSYTVYRQGLMPRNPLAAGGVEYSWGWHVSLLVSLASLVSYVVPVDRVDWYCIFQGLVYAPLGLAVPALVPLSARALPAPGDARRWWWLSALFVAVTNICVGFSGQVLAGVGYPHFEFLSAAGLALMLAALSVGRVRLAWVGIALSIATREDGGLHAGMLLLAVFAAGMMRRPFPITRRHLLVMLVVSFGATFLASAVQKRFFVTPNAWEVYLVGTPPYAHITWEVVKHRAVVFGDRCGFIWLPVLATAVIAAVRRDARYLLGWVAGVPWLLLNFFAKQELKSAFELYTGFPFVGSAFWVGAYARAVLGERAALRSVFAPVVAVSLSSLAGFAYSYPGPMRSLGGNVVAQQGDIDGAAMRRYARALRANPRAYGRILSDASVASWTLESIAREDILDDGLTRRADLNEFHGVTYFDQGLIGNSIYSLLIAAPFPDCGRLPSTRVVYCSRAGALPPGFEPSDPVASHLIVTPSGRREGQAIVVSANARPDIAFFGPFMQLASGGYQATFRISEGECRGDGVPAAVDVHAGRVMSTASVEPGAHEVSVSFEVAAPGPLDRVELRGWSGRCAYTVESVTVRRTPSVSGLPHDETR